MTLKLHITVIVFPDGIIDRHSNYPKLPKNHDCFDSSSYCLTENASIVNQYGELLPFYEFC